MIDNQTWGPWVSHTHVLPLIRAWVGRTVGQ